MTELLVGTKKGLFVLEGEPGGAVRGHGARVRRRAGRVRAARPALAAALLASVTSPFYGPKLFFADDPAGEWEQAEGVALPEGGDAALERIWVIVAGEADGDALRGRRPRRAVREPRRRRDAGQLNRGAVGAPDAAEVAAGRRRAVPALDRPVAGRPRPARGRRSRPPACGSPTTAARAGASGNGGLVAALPARGRARGRRSRSACTACTARRARPGADVHAVPRRRLPLRRRGRELDATSRAACRRTSASRSPLDPADPDSAYVIPLVADIDRVTPDGRVRVYETRDAGASWTPRGDGLPRRARLPDGPARGVRLARRGAALELYFGATSGDVFGSADAGATWFEVARRLPPVYSVTAA